MTAERIKVLLVEDNPGDARLLELLLRGAKDARLELTHVERLDEALSAMAQVCFDALLLDLSLPDSFGFETVERALAAAPHVAIVVLTGMDDEATALEAVRRGAQDYLVKGRVDGHSLVRAVRYAIERKRMEDERVRLIDELREALANVKKLQGLLPICSWCKRIRDDKGYWKQLEEYIAEHSEADISPSICEDCARRLKSEWETAKGETEETEPEEKT